MAEYLLKSNNCRWEDYSFGHKMDTRDRLFVGFDGFASRDGAKREADFDTVGSLVTSDSPHLESLAFELI